MIKLDGLAAFIAVAETGSISEAARRMRLSKSVVSDRLTELEGSLGASLVHRSTRKLTLTEDGVAFLERASRIAHEVEEAAADMAERWSARCASPRPLPLVECIWGQPSIRLSPNIPGSN
jgi:DNA-binding transcriptional LysR family regulator